MIQYTEYQEEITYDEINNCEWDSLFVFFNILCSIARGRGKKKNKLLVIDIFL